MLRLLTITGTTLSVVILLMLSLANTSTTSSHRPKPASKPLMIYCAASNRGVMNALVGDFEDECDVPINVQYGPSQTLLANAEVSGSGDLYLPADDSYLAAAMEKGLISEIFPIARMQLVIAVPSGNPKNIATLQDVLRKDVRLVQANPELAAIGKLTKQRLTTIGGWNKLQAHTDAFVSSVTEAANSLQTGSADAAILYDSLVYSSTGLEAIYIDEFQDDYANVAVGLLQSSKSPEEARRFIRYLTAGDRGLRRYAEFGFSPVGGHPWQDAPMP